MYVLVCFIMVWGQFDPECAESQTTCVSQVNPMAAAAGAGGNTPPRDKDEDDIVDIDE